MQVNPLRGALLLAGGLILALLLWLAGQDERRWLGWIGPPSIAAIALVAYLITLQRTVGRADTFEFQVTAPVLGVAHPTGYPLYLLIGKLFSLLPVGSLAARVNLTSAIAGAVAAALLYLTLTRALRVQPIISGLAALAFAFGPVMWRQAVVAEVYALHNAFVAALLGGMLYLLREEAESEDDRPLPTHRVVVGLFALSGLSLTHHLTAILLFPALALAILLAWPRLTWQQWALAVGLFCAGLLVYLYIPIRWPALNEGRLMPVGDFLAWITGSRFAGALQLRAWLDDPARWDIVGRILLDQYGWIGLILGVFGLIALAIRHWRAALVSGLAFAAQGFYGLNYLVPDIDVFLIPMFLITALWMGYGVHALAGFLQNGVTRRPEVGDDPNSPSPQVERGAGGEADPGTFHNFWEGSFSLSPFAFSLLPVFISLFALLPLTLAWTVGPRFDWSDEQTLESWGRYVLSLPLAEDSVILADSEKIAPLEYLHRLEGLRPDMQMVVLGAEDQYFAYLAQALADGKTVYLQRYLPGLEGTYHLRSVGPLVEVGTKPLTETRILQGESVGWENGITLLGYQLDRTELEAGQIAHLTLYWTAQDILIDNYHVRLRLRDERDRIVWESTPAYPVDNRYPTVVWKPPEIVPDYHAISLPYSLQPGRYAVEVALSRPFSAELAPRINGSGWVMVENLAVEQPSTLPRLEGRRLAISLPDRALRVVSAPDQVPLEGEVQYILRWRAGTGDWLEAGSFRADETAQVSRLAGAPRLAFDGLAGKLSMEGVPMRCGWLRPLTGSCQLAATRVQGIATQPALANFENKLLLLSADFEAGRVNPGELVEVTLHWQALNRMSEDYTIFIHLLGPDGLPHGQVDQWPVQGTFPTSRWEPGQEIEDAYRVPLDPDAPPGSYQLEIGVYLLSTNTRLLVLGPDGNPIDNRILLAGLFVPGP